MTARISLAIAALLIAGPAVAQSTPTQVHTSPQVDPGVYSGRLKVDYPTPYEPATEEAIRKALEQLHAYVDQAAPVRVIDGDTGAPVNDLTRLPAKVALARTDVQILTYEWGVTYAGMLRAAQVTGDPRYRHYTDERRLRDRDAGRACEKAIAAGNHAQQLPAVRAWPEHEVHPAATRAR